MLNEVNVESNKLGMKIYMKNTKIMYNEYINRKPVHIGTEEVEKLMSMCTWVN